MKQWISRILAAALLVSLLSVTAFAAESYGASNMNDAAGKTWSFSAARTETRDLKIFDVGYENDTVEDAAVILVQPGSTITYSEGYGTYIEYTASENGYAPVFATAGEINGTITTEQLFHGDVVMVSVTNHIGETPDEDQETFILLGDDAAPTDPETPAAPVFTDVAESDYYYAPIQWAVENGVTTGTSATTFSPASTCTTAQILTFLWRAVGSPAPAGENPFSDVAEDVYYADAAVWAHEQGLVSGETFNGDAPCTRSAVVTYLWKLAEEPEAEAAAFTDVAADADYAQAVAWAVEQGITTGTSDTTFSPDSTCTRGQIVTFLYRDLVEDAA